TMIDTLMDIAEAETGVMRLRPEPVDLARLLRSAVELYADLAEDGSIALTVDTPAELPVVADAARLRQATANLLDNAVKYTPAGGRVTVAAAREAGGVSITVADTGPGIPA